MTSIDDIIAPCLAPLRDDIAAVSNQASIAANQVSIAAIWDDLVAIAAIRDDNELRIQKLEDKVLGRPIGRLTRRSWADGRWGALVYRYI
jgi:hypothetical protein